MRFHDGRDFVANIRRAASSRLGQVVIFVGVIAATWVALDAVPLAVVNLFGGTCIVVLWFHCIMPPLRYFRVPPSVYWFAAVFTAVALVGFIAMTADDLGWLDLRAWTLVVGVEIVFLVVVATAWVPRYSILIRLFGRRPVER